MTTTIIDETTRLDPAGAVRIPRRHAAAGTLRITGGAAGLTLQAGTDRDDLFAAHFRGERPGVTAGGGEVTVAYPRHDLLGFLLDTFQTDGRRQGELALSPAVPWRLLISGGAADLDLLFTPVALAALTITGGVRHLRLELPAAVGVVPLRIEGGADTITIVRPRASAIRLQIGGGVTRLQFDRQRVGSQGGGGVWDSDASGEAADRYDITITGGAANVSVASR